MSGDDTERSEYHWIQEMSRVRQLVQEAQESYGYNDEQDARMALAEADGVLSTIREDAFDDLTEGSNR